MDTSVKYTYPPVHLLGAVVALRKLNEIAGPDETGNVASFSRDVALQILGYSTTSGRGSNIFSSLNHFGLIERTPNGNYQISPRGQEICISKIAIKRIEAKVAAFKTPTLYKSLFERFGPAFIASTNAKNMLTSQYGVLETQIEEVVDTYNRSLNYLIPDKLDSNSQLRIPSAKSERIDTQNSNVKIEFSSGVVIEVPKKLIYKVVTEEMSKG